MTADDRDLRARGRGTTVDDPLTQTAIASPYLTTVEAADYLRTTVQGIYSLVKRRRLRPMPGRPGRLLFTRDALDGYLSGKKGR